MQTFGIPPGHPGRGGKLELIIKEGDDVSLGVSNERYAIPGCPPHAVLRVGEVASVNQA